ncbi:MAG TPA: permease-like cell division protein FtsX [Bacteroidia bacterium]|nr:permease-like cell division protein FtsX [Bacteroidia bacterium]HNT80780.1 permease-like cell division protein FtsX [Bacteroidia bacterium]
MSETDQKIARRTARTSSISTVISISLVLFMLGALSILILQGHRVSSYLKENIELNVFLKSDVDEDDIKELLNVISNSQQVKSAVYVSKEEAAKKLSDELGEDFVSALGENPLLSSIDVRLKSEFVDTESINGLKRRIVNFPIVKEIAYQEMLVDQVNKNLQTVSLVILAFAGLLFMISLALINNTIRLSMYANRLLIKSMLLVGATRSFIRKPFIWKGVKHGFIAALIANVLLILTLYSGQKRIPELIRLDDYELIAQFVGVVMALGIIISFFSTYLAVNKYLRKRSQDLY